VVRAEPWVTIVQREGGVELTAFVPSLQRPLTATYAGARNARSVYEPCILDVHKVRTEVTRHTFRELRAKTTGLEGKDRCATNLSPLFLAEETPNACIGPWLPLHTAPSGHSARRAPESRGFSPLEKGFLALRPGHPPSPPPS